MNKEPGGGTRREFLQQMMQGGAALAISALPFNAAEAGVPDERVEKASNGTVKIIEDHSAGEQNPHLVSLLRKNVATAETLLRQDTELRQMLTEVNLGYIVGFRVASWKPTSFEVFAAVDL